MAKYLIIGVEGEEQLWLVDCERKTAEQVDADSLSDSEVAYGDMAANISDARRDGFRMVRSIDLAIASESRIGVSVHPRFDGDRG